MEMRMPYEPAPSEIWIRRLYPPLSPKEMASRRRGRLGRAIVCAIIAGSCAYVIYCIDDGSWNPSFIAVYAVVGLLATLELIGIIASLWD